jgi:2-iminobutanoate/2-iminopropanoate deaminase
VLEAGGSGFHKVLKVNIYVTDLDDFMPMNETYREFFEEPLPVSCLEAGTRASNDELAVTDMLMW